MFTSLEGIVVVGGWVTGDIVVCIIVNVVSSGAVIIIVVSPGVVIAIDVVSSGTVTGCVIAEVISSNTSSINSVEIVAFSQVLPLKICWFKKPVNYYNKKKTPVFLS